LVTGDKFSIKSPLMLGEDPEVMLSKQNFVEEVIFKVSIPDDNSEKIIQVSLIRVIT